MPRAKSGKIHSDKRKKVLKDTKGYIGARSTLYKTAKDARRRALQNSYIHRRMKKRDFRRLWIIRINAAARLCDTSYGKLIFGLKKAGIEINRKMLADMAVNDMKAFKEIAETAKSAAA